MTNTDNIILLTDSYKYSHGFQYLPNTQAVYSYFESRNGSKFPYTLFYGLQYIIKKHLEGKVITKEKIDEAEKLITMHLGEGMFDRAKWDYILEKHDGKLPVRIKAVKEGSIIPTSNALLTVENTDDNCPWVTNFIETLLTHVWYTSTVATLSYNIKERVLELVKATTDDNKVGDVIPWMLHNFSARGVENMEAAASNGAAHLLSFSGTDNVMAMPFIQKYYNEGADYCAGYSVRATEHSVMTSRGEEGEWDIVDNLFAKNPDGILSIVIDSYDYKRFLHTMGTRYHDLIVNRNGRVVMRPDSGDPIIVSQDCLNILGEHFGYTINSKGYKVLPDFVRVLWGDGIDEDGVIAIIKESMKNGWSAENWIFGMGGGLAQKVNRDVMRNAFKCSSQKYDGKWHDVWKKPLDMSKASKRGRLAVINEDGIIKTIREEELGNRQNLLETVLEDGVLVREQKFSEIRTLCELK